MLLLLGATAPASANEQKHAAMDPALAKLLGPLGASASASTASVQVKRQATTPTAPEQSSRVERTPLPGTVDVIVGSTAGEDLAGASIRVDGRVAGTAPASLELQTGEHFIQVSKDLYLSRRIRLVVNANEIEKATFDLKPDFAVINITSQPDHTAINHHRWRLGGTHAS